MAKNVGFKSVLYQTDMSLDSVRTLSNLIEIKIRNLFSLIFFLIKI